MNCNRRTDITTGCHAVQQREFSKNLNRLQDKIAKAKSTLNTRPPPSQPHLTLYGRDYAAKKRATTEAAFSDLKMIQAISRTMTRKQEAEERKGPVSLNADSRKKEVYRTMKENHKFLGHLEAVRPTCNTRELINEHKYKQRHMINVSSSARLAGDHDDEIHRIRRENEQHRMTSTRSVELRRASAERLGKTTGSVSLPALTSACQTEPVPSMQCRLPVKRTSAPAYTWTGPGEALAAEQKRGHKQMACMGSPPQPRTAGPARMTEPSASVTGPRPAVRFTAPAPEPPAPIIFQDDEDEGQDDLVSTPLQRALRNGQRSLDAPTKAPTVEDPQEDFDEEDDVEVKARPAAPWTEEPPHAEREEAEPAELKMLPKSGDKQIEKAPPPCEEPLGDALPPQPQEPVLRSAIFPIAIHAPQSQEEREAEVQDELDEEY